MNKETLTQAAKSFVQREYPGSEEQDDMIRKAAYVSFLVGAHWMQKEFSLQGTSGCLECETGRIEVYSTTHICLECQAAQENKSDGKVN